MAALFSSQPTDALGNMSQKKGNNGFPVKIIFRNHQGETNKHRKLNIMRHYATGRIGLGQNSVGKGKKMIFQDVTRSN